MFPFLVCDWLVHCQPPVFLERQIEEGKDLSQALQISDEMALCCEYVPKTAQSGIKLIAVDFSKGTTKTTDCFVVANGTRHVILKVSPDKKWFLFSQKGSHGFRVFEIVDGSKIREFKEIQTKGEVVQFAIHGDSKEFAVFERAEKECKIISFTFQNQFICPRSETKVEVFYFHAMEYIGEDLGFSVTDRLGVMDLRKGGKTVFNKDFNNLINRTLWTFHRFDLKPRNGSLYFFCASNWNENFYGYQLFKKKTYQLEWEKCPSYQSRVWKKGRPVFYDGEYWVQLFESEATDPQKALLFNNRTDKNEQMIVLPKGVKFEGISRFNKTFSVNLYHENLEKNIRSNRNLLVQLRD